MTGSETPKVRTPEWLSQRDGTLTPGVMAGTHHVLIGGRPLYRLDVRPVGGNSACTITSSINGHRFEDPTVTYDGAVAALAGGLEQLRNRLGW